MLLLTRYHLTRYYITRALKSEPAELIRRRQVRDARRAVLPARRPPCGRVEHVAPVDDALRRRYRPEVVRVEGRELRPVRQQKHHLGASRGADSRIRVVQLRADRASIVIRCRVV